MKISSVGLELIKRYEGCVLLAYQCTSNVWTIGYGHTSGVYPGMKITQEQADNFLLEDIKRFENVVNKYGVSNQNEFDALVSFAFNCGEGALSDIMIGGSVTDNMLQYVYSGGTVMQGLVRRRKEEVELFLKDTSEFNNYSLLETGTEVKVKKGAYWGKGKGNPATGEISSDWLKTLNNNRLIIMNRRINDFSDEYYISIYSNDFREHLGCFWIPVNHVSGVEHYVVEKGDTVSEIADKFGVTIESIASFNPIDINRIEIGQILRIK